MTGFCPVKFQDVFGLFVDVHHFGHGHLHAVSQFVLRDARQRFGIADVLVLVFVEVLNGVQRFAAGIAKIDS